MSRIDILLDNQKNRLVDLKQNLETYQGKVSDETTWFIKGKIDEIKHQITLSEILLKGESEVVNA